MDVRQLLQEFIVVYRKHVGGRNRGRAAPSIGELGSCVADVEHRSTLRSARTSAFLRGAY